MANTDALEQFMAQLPTFEEILQSMAEADVPEDLRLPDCTVPPGSDILSPRSSEASWAGAGGGAGAGGRSGARRARFADEEAAKKEHQEAQASTLAMGGEVGEAWSDTRAPTVLNYKLGSDGLPMGSPSPAHNPKHSRVSLPIPIGINKFGAHVFALDVETRDGWTALTRAAVADDVPALKDFIRLGAQIDLETRLRHTALTWAATCGHVPIARELVIAGADPNRITSQGKTPLICAASRGNAEMVVFLLESMMVSARNVRAGSVALSQPSRAHGTHTHAAAGSHAGASCSDCDGRRRRVGPGHLRAAGAGPHWPGVGSVAAGLQRRVLP